MRIWSPIPVYQLDDKGLLGEHRELHCIWNIIKNNSTGGYSNHPETLRWWNHIHALFIRHEKQIQEILNRGFKHNSELEFNYRMKQKFKRNQYHPNTIEPLSIMINKLETKKKERSIK